MAKLSKVFFVVAALLTSGAAMAASGAGSIAEWSGPVEAIGETLAGPVAFWASISLMVVGLIPLASGGELGNGMGRFFNLVLWLGGILLVLSFVTSIFGVGGALI